MRRIIKKAMMNEMRPRTVEASEATDVKQLNNRTKYDVGYDDIIRLLNGSKGSGSYTHSCEGSYGGNSCWNAEYGLKVLRGECKIVSKETVNNDEVTVKSVLIPNTKYCVIVERELYSDINNRKDEKETFHLFTITSGWKKVTVHIQ